MYNEMQVEMAVPKMKTEKTKGEKLRKKRNKQEDVEECVALGVGLAFYLKLTKDSFVHSLKCWVHQQ